MKKMKRSLHAHENTLLVVLLIFHLKTTIAHKEILYLRELKFVLLIEMILSKEFRSIQNEGIPSKNILAITKWKQNLKNLRCLGETNASLNSAMVTVLLNFIQSFCKTEWLFMTCYLI